MFLCDCVVMSLCSVADSCPQIKRREVSPIRDGPAGAEQRSPRGRKEAPVAHIHHRAVSEAEEAEEKGRERDQKESQQVFLLRESRDIYSRGERSREDIREKQR